MFPSGWIYRAIANMVASEIPSIRGKYDPGKRKKNEGDVVVLVSGVKKEGSGG